MIIPWFTSNESLQVGALAEVNHGMNHDQQAKVNHEVNHAKIMVHFEE